MSEEYLITSEVADLLRTSPESVRYWRHLGKGPRSFKIGRRVLYARTDVLEFIDAARKTDQAAMRPQESRPGMGAAPEKSAQTATCTVAHPGDTTPEPPWPSTRPSGRSSATEVPGRG